MKFIVTFMISAMLASAGVFANNDVSDRSGERPTAQHGHAEDVFMTSVPAGAKMAEESDRVRDVKVKELVGTAVVKQRTEEEIGKVKGVIVDNDGKPLGLVVSVDEAPGITAREVAIDWKAVHSDRDRYDRVVVNVDVAIDQIRHAPRFVAGL